MYECSAVYAWAWLCQCHCCASGAIVCAAWLRGVLLIGHHHRCFPSMHHSAYCCSAPSSNLSPIIAECKQIICLSPLVFLSVRLSLFGCVIALALLLVSTLFRFVLPLSLSRLYKLSSLLMWPLPQTLVCMSCYRFATVNLFHAQCVLCSVSNQLTFAVMNQCLCVCSVTCRTPIQSRTV